MTKAALALMTEDELDTLVSIAIGRAEILDDTQSPAAADTWLEVMLYEEQLAVMTSATDVAGGVARVGAVRAALSAGKRSEAVRLASEYLADGSLPRGRRLAIERALQEDEERLARHFPALAKSGRLAELGEWRQMTSRSARVFPQAA